MTGVDARLAHEAATSFRLSDVAVSAVLLAGGAAGCIVGPARAEALRSVGTAVWTLPLFLGAALYHAGAALAWRARGAR